MSDRDFSKTPGTILARAREEKGLERKELASRVRVSRRQLAYLEEDRYGQYEARVFVRGHLRAVARELDLDVEEVLEAYRRYSGDNEGRDRKEEVQRPSPDAEKSAVSMYVDRIARNVRVPHMVAVALVLVAVFVMASFVSGDRATANKPEEFSPDAESEQWELEEQTEETKWLLEKQSNEQETLPPMPDPDKKRRSE